MWGALLSAGLSGLGSILGGSASKSAASRAASAQMYASNQALSAINEGVGDAAQMLQPWSNAGAGASGLMNAALGIPTGQGGIAQSGVASEDAIAEELLNSNEQFRNNLVAETQNRKSKLYGMSLSQAVKYWRDNLGGSASPAMKDAEEKVKAKAAADAQTTASAAPTQDQAKQVFDNTQWAQDAKTLGTKLQTNADTLTNQLWQPIGGKGATFDQSPWRSMTDRATTKANDMFLNLAGSAGKTLSGATARGLQENAANINDSMYGDYLNAYNNAASGQYGSQGDAATGAYNANTSAFDKWISSLDTVANRGYGADSAAAGYSANKGAQLANVNMANGQSQAQAATASGNASTNALQGVFNSLGTAFGSIGSGVSTTSNVPRTNSLYTPNLNTGYFGSKSYSNIAVR